MAWIQRAATAAAIALSATALAQAPSMIKVDPPNWWATMPKPMLLIQGEHLDGAHFRISDRALRIDHTKISANGHWAELWLSASPNKPETVDIVAERQGATAKLPYRFDPRRPSTEGFAGFSSQDVMYLIMTDRFADGDPSNDNQPADSPDQKTKIRGWHGGDLRGVTQHLDYLQQLGVTTVWITPVYQNHEEGSYHGYGATDMYAVDEHFGNLEDLKALAAALHARGMKLVLDTVPNHVGPAHPWVDDSPEPDWFHGTKDHHREAQGDFKSLTDPHAPWRDQRNVTEGWFANILPDMNQENPAVAQYLTQNAVWWTEESGLDGLRLDTFPYIARDFWRDFHAELHQLYPRVTTVGEVLNPDATITSAFAGGVTRNGVDTGLDTPFDYPSYFALLDVFLRDAPTTRLAEVLRMDALYPHPERLVPFLGNHDNARFLSEPGATPAKLKLAFVVLSTMRGMPELYSGDEIAMQGGGDPDNRRDFPGGFPGDAQNAFEAATRTPGQQDMHTWVKGLLALRSTHPALQTGEEQILEAAGNTLIFVRGENLHQGCQAGTNNERIMVLVNNGDNPETLTLQPENTALSGCHITNTLWGKEASVQTNGPAIQITIPPRQASIVSFH